MLKEEKTRILAKLEEVENYVEELKDILPDEEEFTENLVKKRACEKTIELAIESMIDVCAMLISFHKLGMPSDEDSIFDILEKKKIISPELAKKLRQMKGFRNIIVHKYGDVDDSLTFEYLSENLDDFSEFKEAVLIHLENGKNRKAKK